MLGSNVPRTPGPMSSVEQDRGPNMQRVYFCTGSSFYTGDAIARAVMDYARALGELRRFDSVELPVRHLDGSEGRASLLLSPSSQISSESARTNLPEVRDELLIDRLRAATEHLHDPLLVAPPETEWDEDLVPGI